MDLPKLLERFVPEFDSLLLPLKEVPNSELMGSAVALAMQALKAATDPHEVLAEVLLQVASRLKEMSVEQQAECRRGLIYLYQLVRHKRPSEEQESLFELLDEVLESELSGESEEAKMTGAQVLLAQGRKEGRREGREEGREEGRQEGQQELLLELLTSKFGNLPEPMMSRINRLTNEQIKELAKQVLKASSLQELNM